MLIDREHETSGFAALFLSQFHVSWNPDCGFCTQMLPDLKRWEEGASTDSPQLVVVSAGTAEKNRAMGLRAPILLDQTFAAGRAFYVRGTPAAALINAKGLIASRIAGGSDAVFELANLKQPFAKANPRDVALC